MIHLEVVNIRDLKSLGLKVFDTKRFEDERGALLVEFEESFVCKKKLDISFKRSFSKAFVGRGLHHQTSLSPQTKIISVVKGRVLDLVYDTSEEDAPIYAFELSEEDGFRVQIPPNFAHGFISLSDVEFEYHCFGAYDANNETIYNVLDSAAKTLGIGQISISKKDASAKTLITKLKK